MVTITQLPISLIQRIVLPSHPADCWLWAGTRAPNGYGQVKWHGRRQPVHRVVYELLVGPIPEGLVTDHLCRVRACVNPAHVEPVVNRENIMRGLVPTANRTLCKSEQHVLADVGVYVDSDGCERCRACRLDSKRRHRQRAA